MNGERSAASIRALEIAVALIIFAFGAVVVYGSVRVGTRWGDEGPQAGYVPFYVGLLIMLSAVVTLARAIRDTRLATLSFVTRGQLKLILTVLVPTAAYVGLIAWAGFYVASSLYIALFMSWIGKYPWRKILPIAIGVSVAFFLTFELWFAVPLPKGLLEAALGLN